MKKLVPRIGALVLLTLILAPAALAETLTVAFDKQVYDIGDIVTLTVNSPRSGSLAIEVYSPTGSLVWIDERSVEPGTSTITFKLPDNSVEGVYTAYIALDNSQPAAYSFRVVRPRLLIESLAPSSLTVAPSTPVALTITVRNTGAEGLFKLQVVNQQGSIIAESPSFSLAYNEETVVTLSITSPETAGNYVYTVRAYNIKYGVVDDEKSFTISVAVSQQTTTTPPPTTTPTTTPPQTTTPTTTPILPPITPPPPAPIAPPPAVTVTTTVTQTVTPTTSPPVSPPPATATTPPVVTVPAAIPTYVANLAGAIVNGVVARPVKIVIPQAGVEVVLPAAAHLVGPTGEPVQPEKLVVQVLMEPPKPLEAGELVSPIYNISLGVPVKLDIPATIALPFNKTLVPEGYRVYAVYYNESAGTWQVLPTISVDYEEGVVTAVTPHLSLFAVAALPPAAATVTVPVTTTVTTTETETLTTSIPVTVTSEITRTETETTTVTVTAAPVTVTTTSIVTVEKPVTVSVTREKTVTSTVEVTRTKTTASTVTTVKTVPQVSTVTTTVTEKATSPAALAALAIGVLALVAAIYLYTRARQLQGV